MPETLLATHMPDTIKEIFMMKLKRSTFKNIAAALETRRRLCTSSINLLKKGEIDTASASRNGRSKLPITAYNPTCTATNLGHWPGSRGESPVCVEKDAQAIAVNMPTLMLETKPYERRQPRPRAAILCLSNFPPPVRKFMIRPLMLMGRVLIFFDDSKGSPALSDEVGRAASEACTE